MCPASSKLDDAQCFYNVLFDGVCYNEVLKPLMAVKASNLNRLIQYDGTTSITALAYFVIGGKYFGDTTFFNDMVRNGAIVNAPGAVPLLVVAAQHRSGVIVTPTQVAFLLQNGCKLSDLGADPLGSLAMSAEMINYAVDTLKLPVKASHIIQAMPFGGVSAAPSPIFNALVAKAAKGVLNQVSPVDAVSPLMKAFTQFEVSSFSGDRTTEPICILLDAGADIRANGVYDYAVSSKKLCAVVPGDSSCAAASGPYAAVQTAIAAAAVTPTNSSAIDPVLDQWEAAFPSPPPDDVILTSTGDAYKTQSMINKKLLPIFESEVAFLEANWISSGGDTSVADPNNAAPRIQRVHDYVLNQFINNLDPSQQGAMKDDYSRLDALLNRVTTNGQWWGGKRRSRRRSRKARKTASKKRKRMTKYNRRK